MSGDLIHKQPSPFPRATPKGTVVDEWCTCGCLRSMHQDTVAFGHGSCTYCKCDKFSWSRMRMEDGQQ